ncbi:MAG: hypothetical protein M3010_07640, partial [Candidatus Dormibacteraeota bacterium]|nr:hypothetical protein [Candidatus Dormibacteraeota bacterium]
MGVVLLLAVLAGAGPTGRTAAAPPRAGTPRYYPATGQTLGGEFTAFYDAHGGLAVFGYPISDVHYEGAYLVQYCERERLEYHPENAGSPFDVLLGRLGAALTAGRPDGPFAPAVLSTYLPAHTIYVPQTHQRLAGDFLDYW